MQILVVDPYYTYSHQVWLEGISANCDHEVSTLTLPAYHWKWRMHGGTLQLAQQFMQSGLEPDVIIATDMLDLSLFIAQCKGFLKPTIPLWLYFHENQLTYPVSALDRDKPRGYDNHYGFINFTSALIADHLIFNSKFHRRSFLAALSPFLDQFPKPKLSLPLDDLDKKSLVIYPGFDLASTEQTDHTKTNKVPIVLWNHRWEYDKDPDTFFEVLATLSSDGYEFELAVLGQQFSHSPPIFERAFKQLEKHIIHWGFVPNRNEYCAWLNRADLIVSTSNQDFFGISVVEAIAAGCQPILPNRLAFPEHIPSHLQSSYLYSSKDELCNKLRHRFSSWPEVDSNVTDLVKHVTKFNASHQAKFYNQLFDQVGIT